MSLARDLVRGVAGWLDSGSSRRQSQSHCGWSCGTDSADSNCSRPAFRDVRRLGGLHGARSISGRRCRCGRNSTGAVD